MKNPWISNAIVICRSANFAYLISVVDVDECTATPPKCAGAGQRCTNFPGAYRCSCVSPRQQLNDDESACIGMYGALALTIKLALCAYGFKDELSYSFHMPDFFRCPLNEL
jgi:hypothetical protein